MNASSPRASGTAKTGTAKIGTAELSKLLYLLSTQVTIASASVLRDHVTQACGFLAAKPCLERGGGPEGRGANFSSAELPATAKPFLQIFTFLKFMFIFSLEGLSFQPDKNNPDASLW